MKEVLVREFARMGATMLPMSSQTIRSRPGTRRQILGAALGVVISLLLLRMAIGKWEDETGSWLVVGYLALLTLSYLAVGCLAVMTRHRPPREDLLYFTRLFTLFLTLLACIAIIVLGVFYAVPFALLVSAGRLRGIRTNRLNGQ